MDWSEHIAGLEKLLSFVSQCGSRTVYVAFEINPLLNHVGLPEKWQLYGRTSDLRPFVEAVLADTRDMQASGR